MLNSRLLSLVGVTLLLPTLVNPLAAQRKFVKPTATPVNLIKAKKDFQVELLYSVPKETKGSWVSMCVDPKGRLIVSDQYGKLFRVTPAPVGSKADTVVESIPADIGEAQGLLWAHDSLYVVVNRGQKYPSGLYRVRSSMNNDILDKVELLRVLDGAGEHGPHAVLLGPDGKSLYVLCGNHSRHPKLSGSLVPPIWGEDFIVPRQWDASGHAVGILAPGGFICKTDPDGKDWQMVSIGYRNQYDAAFNRAGELFTYDSDMEWDINLPWYKPTRVCHAVPGSEFGWRSGTSNFPAYYPDSLSNVVDIGPGSPTGVCFGYGAKFPAKYQDALFLCDWSYGKIYAVHLKAQGSTYVGETEEFLNGSPLPLTDIVVNPKDGALYFAIGGRKTMSGLYRVTYHGKQSTAPAKDVEVPEKSVEVNFDKAKAAQFGVDVAAARQQVQREMAKVSLDQLGRIVLTTKTGQTVPLSSVATLRLVEKDNAKMRELRHKLEAFYDKKDPAAVDAAWPYLKSDDRFLRFAARTVLEFQDAKTWQDKALAETDPIALTHALLGLVRVGDKALLPKVIDALERIDWSKLNTDQRLDLLRVYQLAFIRMGPADADSKAKATKRLDVLYPANTRELNVELAKVLSYLEPADVVTKSLALLAKAPTQEEQIDYLFALRTVKNGWTKEQREAYFNWFQKAASYRGHHSFFGFLRNIRNDAVKNLGPAERDELKTILAVDLKPVQPKFTTKERPLVKKWSIDELVPIVEKGLSGRDYDRGRNLFGEAKCFACHRFNNEGGGTGPDLTIVSGRFSTRDLLESILEPSKVVSDQYQAIVVVTTGGQVVTGRIVNLGGDNISINTDLLDPNKITGVNRNQIETIEPSKTSMMPNNLLDTFSQDEILDLVGYLLSRGDRSHKMFTRAKE